MEDKPKYRIDPNVSYRVRKLVREKEKDEKEAIDKYIDENDISDLVTPYMADPVLNNILSYTLGVKDVNKMSTINALAYSGIVNTSCPVPGDPYKTEKYINILTGTEECREPFKERQQVSGPKPGECGPGLEHYIDYFGVAHCERPVLSGSFQCPPRSDPGKTKRVTINNGVGICVTDPTLKADKEKVIMPNTLIFPDAVNAKLVDFLKIYNGARYRSNQVEQLKYLFNNQGGDLAQLKNSLNIAALSGDPSFVSIANSINSTEDVGIAQTALARYAKGTGQLNTNNIGDVLAFSQVTPDLILGGAPRRHS